MTTSPTGSDATEPLAAPPPGPTSTAAAPTAPSPERPDVTLAGWLVVAGAAIALLGAFLPWVTGPGESINGFGDFVTGSGSGDPSVMEGPALATVFGALIAAGLGVALVGAGRIKAVAILAVVSAALGVLFGIVMVVTASDTASFVNLITAIAEAEGGAGIGIGVILQPVGPLVALAGGIVALVKHPGRPTSHPEVLLR